MPQTMKLTAEVLMENMQLLLSHLSSHYWRPAADFAKLAGVQLFLRTITLISDWPPYAGKYVCSSSHV